jgi:hypothetical protein
MILRYFSEYATYHCTDTKGAQTVKEAVLILEPICNWNRPVVQFGYYMYLPANLPADTSFSLNRLHITEQQLHKLGIHLQTDTSYVITAVSTML